MRICDGCELCCTSTAVPELHKPQGVTCKHCDKGCLIYESRPKSCRDFECAWLAGDMPDWMKPDKVHFMIEKLPNVPVVLAFPEKGHEATWRSPEVVAALKREYQYRGVAVVAADGQALLPEGTTGADVKRDVMSAAKAMGVVP